MRKLARLYYSPLIQRFGFLWDDHWLKAYILSCVHHQPVGHLHWAFCADAEDAFLSKLGAEQRSGLSGVASDLGRVVPFNVR